MADYAPWAAMDLRVPEPRQPRRRRPPRRVMDVTLAGSALVHCLALALLVFVHRAAPMPPPEQPGFAMVFDDGKISPEAVPNPGRYIERPSDAARATVAPPTQQTPEPPPEASPAPQVNLLPPEMRMMPPPMQQPGETDEAPPPPERPAARARTAPQVSPFSHVHEYSFASRPDSGGPQGLHNSRSMNLSLGMLVKGGMLRDAVPHVSSPGADGDYLSALSDYVETHKYYPQQAADNGEDGTSVIRATIVRDGTVKNVQLMESSGSRMLDVAWMSLFRSKHLPPFPDDMKENQRDFTLSMDYELISR
jgi:protein TonB